MGMANQQQRSVIGLGLAFALLFAGTAGAMPDETGTTTFENLDTPPFYFKATVDVEVFNPGNSASPLFSATDFTYVYTLTNLLAAPPTGQMNIPVDRLDIGVGSSAVISAATSIDDVPGVAPSNITISATKVVFDFAPAVNPGGDPSDRLVIQSGSGPGDVNATVALSIAFVDDQLVRGPAALPAASFACFDVNKAKIKIKTNEAGKDELKIEKGVIDLGPGDSFDPATEAIKLNVNDGLLVETIPAGSFEQKGSNPKFKFKTGSSVTPAVHVHLNLDKGEWEFKIKKTDLSVFAGATELKSILMVGDVKGEVTVPLTEETKPNKIELKFKRSPKVACIAETPEEEGKRSCLSFVEVTYKTGLPEQEIIQKFSDEIGHPETTFVASDGASATFHTSCSQCLVCGQTDANGLFEITGISDATGKLGQKCGVPDASCGVTPPAP